MFENCFPNTLDTTVMAFNDTPGMQDGYIITGDINATWLRDSTNQVLPYVPYAAIDSHLRDLICGIIHRQTNDVLNDSFANAFNYANEGGPHQDDEVKPPMNPHVYESKYELDSLAAALKLSWNYWYYTQDTSCFAGGPASWLSAVRKILDTVEIMQRGTDAEGINPTYTFGEIQLLRPIPWATTEEAPWPLEEPA